MLNFLQEIDSELSSQKSLVSQLFLLHPAGHRKLKVSLNCLSEFTSSEKVSVLSAKKVSSNADLILL